MHYWSNNRLLLSVMFLVAIMITCDAFGSPSCHKKILIRPYTTAKQNHVNPLLSSRNDDTDDKQQKGLSSVGEKDNFDAAGFGYCTLRDRICCIDWYHSSVCQICSTRLLESTGHVNELLRY